MWIWMVHPKGFAPAEQRGWVWIHRPTQGALCKPQALRAVDLPCPLQPQAPAHALQPELDLGVCSSSLNVLALRREQNTSPVRAFQSSLCPDSSVRRWTRCSNSCVCVEHPSLLVSSLTTPQELDAYKALPTCEVPGLHPFAYQGCLCNFQHNPGHRNMLPCGSKSLHCFLSRICPLPACELPSSPWIYLNRWHSPGIIPQSVFCAATVFWGLSWFTSVDAGWCVPPDFKVQEHLFPLMQPACLTMSLPLCLSPPQWHLPFQISAAAVSLIPSQPKPFPKASCTTRSRLGWALS